MEIWHSKIKQDLSHLPDFIDYYQEMVIDAKKEIHIKGRVEQHCSMLPTQVETRFNELQDIEAVLEYLNINYRKLRAQKFKKFFENQNIGRALTARDCDRYVDADSEVNDMAEIINEVALVRNQYLGLLKGLDNKQWQLTNIVKLRTVGIEDASI